MVNNRLGGSEMLYFVKTKDWVEKHCYRDNKRFCSTVACTAWIGDADNGYCYKIYGNPNILEEPTEGAHA